jgi:hypothetical protein
MAGQGIRNPRGEKKLPIISYQNLAEIRPQASLDGYERIYKCLFFNDPLSEHYQRYGVQFTTFAVRVGISCSYSGF